MQIRITGTVPVQPRFRPKKGEIHNVVRMYESSISSNIKSRVFYIKVNGALIGVWGRECEVVKA